MAPKYVGLIVFIWIIAGLCQGVIEGTMLGANESGVLNGVMSWTRVFSEQDFGIVELVGTIPTFFVSLFKMFTFDYSFFKGEWEIVRWILLAPLMATFVFGLVTMFFGMYQKSI